MSAPVGGIFYYELKYGNTKGKVNAGDLLVRDFNAYYSSEIVDEELLGSNPGASVVSTLDYTPVKVSTVEVYADNLSGTDDGAGAIVGDGVSGTVDYETGAISLNFGQSITGDVTSKYSHNTECSSNIPQVNIDISLVEIRATTRKLKALWCSEAADDLRALHGVDAEAEIVAGIASEIALEIDREIIDDLRIAATLDSTFNLQSVPAGVTPLHWYRNLVTNLTVASNRIHKDSLRGAANFCVTSPEVSAYIEQLETHGDFRPLYASGSSDARGPVEQPHEFGVYKIGTISSKYMVYKDTYFPVTSPGSGSGFGDILMGYKGSNWIDTGYCWAPYVPLQITATFLDPNDFQNRKGMRTRYAKKLLRSEFYRKVRVTGL